MLASANIEVSRPDEKCGPVEEITITRARALWSMSSTMAGSSSQKARIMLLRFSGRFRRMWAMWSAIETSKH